MPPKTIPSRKRGRPRKDDTGTASKKPRLGGRQPTDQLRDVPNPDENRQGGKNKNKNDVYDFHDPDEAAVARTPSKAQPKLKGILTPSRRHSERAPKSVAFDDPKRGEVFFEDIVAKPVKSARKTPSKPQEESEEEPDGEADEEPDETEDDEVCVLCSKPDSKAGNQILFCDGCDLAVHQKCYGVPRIPRGDWLCKDCSQAPSITTENGVKSESQRTTDAVIEAAPDIPNFEQHLHAMKRVLSDRCTGRRRMGLRDQDEAYEKTFQLVQQTVLAGEGNSMLVIGARGCGKTTMVESVLSDLGLEHRDQFHVVRLNGFIHTDDKLALKDIWRQLGKEMEVEDDLIGKTNNYADTLASLLALLSHPSEIAESHEGVTSKSVVFIIDEFDLFATHARQTLLYNLFDIAQARKAPIAVLGLTNRIDVVESLEKRVKSRFSHRYVYLSLSKTLPAYWAVCKQGLAVEDEDAKAEGLPVTLQGFTKFQEYWTKKIEALYKDQTFKDHLEYHYYSTKSVPAFLNSCVLPLAALTPSSLSLRFTPGPGSSLDPPDSKLYLLESLSDLDLSLLISAARLDIVAHMDTVNFAMAYDEYTTLMGRQRVQSATSGMLALGGGVRVWGRGVAEICWERLVSLGLLLPTGMGGRMCKVDVALEEIPTGVKLNTMLAKWCKEL
ncbi:origin recognition complex subunit 4 [Diaporthe australafricana]|uniref:Origin recognition complex subunit 4 n=1 Tax=Diaporthe australafricana TaxID=127596 RepID=A0ABR3WG21_9PEZI